MQPISPESVLQNFKPFVDAAGGNAVFAGKKTRRRVLYAAVLGSTLATNQNKMLLPSDTKGIGRTNFDFGNKLAEGKELTVVGIRFLFDSTTPSVTTNIAVWTDLAPASFKNGEVSITLQGVGEIFNNPILPFCPKNNVNVTNDEFTPVSPFVLTPNKEIDILISQAGTPIGASTAVRIELDCIETAIVGQA